MVQLQCMDACLNTLFTELYKVNVRVGHITWWQATIGGFTPEACPPPPPVASDSEDEDDDDGDDDDVFDNDDGDASSTNGMSTWHSYPLSLVTKGESSLGYESSHF